MNFERPHYRWNAQKEMFSIMTTEISKAEVGVVPGWMRAKSTGASLGNVDGSDLKPPRLKLLAGLSPEVMDAVPGAAPGNFWMTIINQNLGKEVTGSPILLRKSYQLWAPKGTSEQKGPLATSSDGIHWDNPNQKFEVKHLGNPKVYVWRIGKLVTEYGMNRFGSSQDDDPKSKPAATLTYDILWLVDLPNSQKQLCVFTASRTGVAPTQNFISSLKAMGVDQYFQRYRMVVRKRPGPSGDPYFTFEYQYIGNLTDEKEGDAHQAIYQQYAKSGFIADLESEAADIDSVRGTPVRDQPIHEDHEDIPF